MKRTSQAPKRTARARKPSTTRDLKVKPLDASKVRGGYYSRIDGPIKGGISNK